MSQLDWIILCFTIFSIVIYGLLKNRKDKNLDDYLLGNRSLPWYHVCLSTMATQASAITFISAPGQGYADGLRFVQFYFGLPLAILLISIVFIPIFHKLKVFTAYEYLENRFDTKVRIFTATLFLLSRGLATGLSIYAPSIILSTIFKWDIVYTNILMGCLVLVYTVVGGTKAISHTHVQQMFFVLLALLSVGFLTYSLLPEDLSLVNTLKLAGKAGKMNAINYEFDPKDRYNIWSGLIGGFFLQLSYFGTDQSQVGRYITGSSKDESKLGLIINGFLKIPMQFFILLIGVFMFCFYLFNTSPLVFNRAERQNLMVSEKKEEFNELNSKFNLILKLKQESSLRLKELVINDQNTDTEANILNDILKEENIIREETKKLSASVNPKADTNEVNYVFLDFLLEKMPKGLIGFIIAVIFTASMGSVASAYSSLAASSQVDIINKTKLKPLDSAAELKMSKYLTFFWGILCIIIANFAQKIGNSLIELVNILGSWFYGVILGIFLVAFFLKHVKSKAVLWGAVISEIIIIFVWYKESVAYLWLNPFGVILVVGFSLLFQFLFNLNHEPKKDINS